MVFLYVEIEVVACTEETKVMEGFGGVIYPIHPSRRGSRPSFVQTDYLPEPDALKRHEQLPSLPSIVEIVYSTRWSFVE